MIIPWLFSGLSQIDFRDPGEVLFMETGPENSHRLNPFRILWHFVAGTIVFITVLLSRDGFRPDIWLLTVTSLLLVLVDIFRFGSDRGKRLFWKYLGFLSSRKEEQGPNTSLYYALSLLACSLLFPREALLGAVVCLAAGDPVAIIVGKNFGRIRIKRKSVEGAIANFAVCFTILVFVLPSIRMAAAGALAGAIIEIMPLPVDDNITIPLFSAGAITLVAFFMKQL